MLKCKPCETTRITSGFNPSRKHPVTGVLRPHNGIDFALAG
jgi:murein DD-endopeptidase MepM/ murein hydrolase activator NlpD